MHSADPLAIAALLDSLRDESPRIVAAAREKLRALGEPGMRALERCEESEDARLRVRARAALHELRQEAAVRAVLELAALPGSELDLEDGVFRLAAVEDPALDKTPYAALLDSLGEQLTDRLGPPRGRPILAAAAAELARLLAGEQRLRVNDERFDDPENSFIHRVLERRRGIPISIAAVYMLVARRAELPLAGIGAPGYFLLRMGPAELDMYLEPSTGRRMTLEESMRMLAIRGFPVTRAHFTAATTREMFVRMCANLVTSYDRRKATAAVARWASLRDAFRGTTA
jgi:regulator of sirC expression with transglutaminase-like and TPR domain